MEQKGAIRGSTTYSKVRYWKQPGGDREINERLAALEDRVRRLERILAGQTGGCCEDGCQCSRQD